MKNVLTSLSKSALLPLRLTAATSAIDAAIQNKIYKSGMTTLIISNEEMDDITKIVKYFEKSGLLEKGACKTIGNEAREQKGGFFDTLLATLGASLLENMLASKTVI